LVVVPNIDELCQAAINKKCCTGTVLPLADALREVILERNAARMVIRTLINHLDEMAHVTHRANHGGFVPGYYDCGMPYCRDTAALLKHLESVDKPGVRGIPIVDA
jgi:hypothetical protein